MKSKIATSEFAAKHDLNPIVVMRAAKRLSADKKSGIKAVQEGRFWHVQAR